MIIIIIILLLLGIKQLIVFCNVGQTIILIQHNFIFVLILSILYSKSVHFILLHLFLFKTIQ